jgi:hypothetical protein
MTELQVKGLIGSMCDLMFGKDNWKLFHNDEDDFILISTDNAGDFIGDIHEVYCELKRLFSQLEICISWDYVYR